MNVVCAFLLLQVACRPPTDDSQRKEFFTRVLAEIDLAGTGTWARTVLTNDIPVGTLLANDSYPESLRRRPPLFAQVVIDVPSGLRCLFLTYRMGLIREGIMLGPPDLRMRSTRGYRYEITNGVFYVLDHG